MPHPMEMDSSDDCESIIRHFRPLTVRQRARQGIDPITSTPMDIPKHAALRRGQRFTKARISHIESPSIVHLMLSEDFHRACHLLRTMASHADLQADRTLSSCFQPQVNHICACRVEDRWFRCRVSQVSFKLATVDAVCLDWGMTVSVPMEPDYLRRLPNEFHSEPACCIRCHLAGVTNISDAIPLDTMTRCVDLLSKDDYEVAVSADDSIADVKIRLSTHGRSINDAIQKLLSSHVSSLRYSA